MTSSKDSTSGAQSNPKAIHHHLEIIKKLKPAVLEDFLITSRWLSLSRLLKLKDLSQGEHEQLLSLLLSLDATQNERLIREVTELLLSQDVSSDKETLDEDHLTSTTITLIGEGEGALDLHVDHLPDESSQSPKISNIQPTQPPPLPHTLPPASSDTDAVSDAVSDMREPPPLLSGRYQLVDLLGEGGMCYVKRAFDQRLGREVALKHLKPSQLKNQEARQHFEVEARVLGRLAHPNLLPVYDFVEDSALEGLGYTMRVLPYPSLYELCQGEARLSHHELCQVLRQVALALETAHQQGVVHRDVKPHNILIGPEGEVYLTDWGICALSEHHPDAHLVSKASAHALMGTPSFMAPEQLSCDLSLITPRTDVYGLGATLYCALTGAPPFEGESLVEVMRKVSNETPVPLNKRVREVARRTVPLALEQLCERAMSKRPEARFKSARAFAQALDAHLTGELERERERAAMAESLKVGHEARARFEMLKHEKSALKGRLSALRDELSALQQGDDIKAVQTRRAPLWNLEERLDDLVTPLEESFTKASAAYSRVLSSSNEEDDEQNALLTEAREALSGLLWVRFEEAEREGDQRYLTYVEEQLKEVGTDEVKARLEGLSELDLSELPSGVKVEVISETLQRYHTRSRLISTQHTPLSEPLKLPRGAYLLRLSHPKATPCALHIKLKRASKHTLRPKLLKANALPKDCVYVPDREGGAGVVYMQHLVTYREYVDFLNDLNREERALAEARAPRYGGVMYAERGEGGDFKVPFVDAEGDEWSPDWPVMLVSAYDIEAYASWRAEKDKQAWRLPTAEEWLHAAQGADERPYPWGLDFDASLCLMRASLRGRVTPLPVGSVPTDCSPYGLFDVAGNVCQWTSSCVEGERDVHRVMGSSFNSVAATCHLRAELSSPAGACMMHIGARLVFTPRTDQLLSASHINT